MLVLLFEPDQVRGNHVFDQLRDLDVSLYWVSTVQEADQALFEENFDVVVVDLKSIDGSARRVDFVCELRRKSPGSVFLAVTGDHRDALALDGCVEAIVTSRWTCRHWPGKSRHWADGRADCPAGMPCWPETFT